MHMNVFKKIGVALRLISPAVISEGQKAVAAIASSTVGKVIADEIHIVASADMTGAEKRAAVVAKAKPLIAELIAGDGKAMINEVGDVAEAVVQEIYNRVASITVGAVAKAILKALTGK